MQRGILNANWNDVLGISVGATPPSPDLFMPEFVAISMVCTVFCALITLVLMHQIWSAIKDKKTLMQRLSIPLNKYALLFTAVMLVYLGLQITDMVTVSLRVFCAPEIEILMDFCLGVLVIIWMRQWRQMIYVFIRKKFTQVRLSEKDPAARTGLVTRINNLAGKCPARLRPLRCRSSGPARERLYGRRRIEGETARQISGQEQSAVQRG